jgi:ketosteroid isomerase-like protein
MSTTDNKTAVSTVFDAFALGDARPFLRLMTPEVEWTVVGSADWGRTYVGKKAVIEDLLTPLAEQIEGGSVAIAATSILAEGDRVVVEGQGRSTTIRGDPYCNRYCFVLTLADGRITRLTEYMDSSLVERALTAPARPA